MICWTKLGNGTIQSYSDKITEKSIGSSAEFTMNWFFEHIHLYSTTLGIL